MAEENVYRVLLVHRDHRVIEGFHVYRGEQLPERGQFITVETALSPVPLQSPGPVQSRRARVNRVTPNEKFPIHVEELKP